MTTTFTYELIIVRTKQKQYKSSKNYFVIKRSAVYWSETETLVK